MLSKIILWFLKIYQKFFTLIGYGSCRFYPTCSEYAKWQVTHNNLLIAMYKSIARILRCNQLFEGGIDYPVATTIKKPKILSCKRVDFDLIKFFFVPRSNGGFFIVKRF